MRAALTVPTPLIRGPILLLSLAFGAGCLTRTNETIVVMDSGADAVPESALDTSVPETKQQEGSDAGGVDSAAPGTDSGTIVVDAGSSDCGDGGRDAEVDLGCSPGTAVCIDDGTLSYCDERRTWVQRACFGATPLCDDSQCVTCLPGTVTCADASTMAICTPAHTWQAAVVCNGSTPVCFRGACLECVPGATRSCGNCDEGTQTCSAAGAWGVCENEPGPQRMWYQDKDGDGYGTPNYTQWSCAENIPGFALVGRDCCDVDDRVHPGASEYQAVGNAGCGNGWDFDCDGVVTKERTGKHEVEICNYYECQLAQGWADYPLPECGESALFVSSCTNVTPQQCGRAGCSCALQESTVQQRCR